VVGLAARFACTMTPAHISRMLPRARRGLKAKLRWDRMGREETEKGFKALHDDEAGGRSMHIKWSDAVQNNS
jgi:hypothetical protein